MKIIILVWVGIVVLFLWQEILSKYLVCQVSSFYLPEFHNSCPSPEATVRPGGRKSVEEAWKVGRSDWNAEPEKFGRKSGVVEEGKHARCVGAGINRWYQSLFKARGENNEIVSAGMKRRRNWKCAVEMGIRKALGTV